MVTDYTIPVYVINLDSSKKRLCEFSKELGKFDMSFTRIPAIRFQLSNENENELYREAQPPVIKHPLSGAEIGCFLSHHKVWKTIAEGQAPIALVCEDDTRLSNNFTSVLNHVGSSSPNWDILRLYSHKQESPIQTEAFVEGHSMVTVKKITMSTVAYFITKPAAQRLSDIALPVSIPVDAFLKRWWMHGLCSKQIWPSVAFPSDDALDSSTIESQRSTERSGNALTRFWTNAQYQIYLNAQRRKYKESLPLNRVYF